MNKHENNSRDFATFKVKFTQKTNFTLQLLFKNQTDQNAITTIKYFEGQDNCPVTISNAII